MQCSCGYEPRDRLLHMPCPQCGNVWWDTESYVRELGAVVHPVATTLDIGCGLKGIIGEAYWREIGIVKGYGCDRHAVKVLVHPFEAVVADAETLLQKLGPKSIDFTTHCGLLEHIPYDKALRVLRTIELLTKKCVFFTCSAMLREVDYKVQRDGNPYHYYLSWWDAHTMESLGYRVDRLRMRAGITFQDEVVGWYYPDKLYGDWGERRAAAIKALCDRRCNILSCSAEPIFWDCRLSSNVYFCVKHALEQKLPWPEQLKAWIDRGGTNISKPPWRKENLQPLALD